MIEAFTKAWFANLDAMRQKFAANHPEDYEAIVKIVVQMLAEASNEYDKPDPERIHRIDDGDYQGTDVYVIGASDYQPSRYWYVKISYGSCSQCDALQNIRGYTETDSPSPDQVKQYMTLALHIVQGLREMDDNEV